MPSRRIQKIFLLHIHLLKRWLALFSENCSEIFVRCPTGYLYLVLDDLCMDLVGSLVPMYMLGCEYHLLDSCRLVRLTNHRSHCHHHNDNWWERIVHCYIGIVQDNYPVLLRNVWIKIKQIRVSTHSGCLPICFTCLHQVKLMWTSEIGAKVEFFTLLRSFLFGFLIFLTSKKLIPWYIDTSSYQLRYQTVLPQDFAWLCGD